MVPSLLDVVFGVLGDIIKTSFSVIMDAFFMVLKRSCSCSRCCQCVRHSNPNPNPNHARCAKQVGAACPVAQRAA